jgi:hypothetical protein
LLGLTRVGVVVADADAGADADADEDGVGDMDDDRSAASRCGGSVCFIDVSDKGV